MVSQENPEPSWRIDGLAQQAGLTVDTIRFYQREGLLPAAERSGRAKVYGADHLERLTRIRDLQARRFSLAAIRALLNSERPDLVNGIFAGEGGLSYSLSDLVERSGCSQKLLTGLRDNGLLRDPRDFGRDAYDATDLDVMRAAAELVRGGLPEALVVELAAIYVRGVEAMQVQVLDLFGGAIGPAWEPEELSAFQAVASGNAGRLLPLVTRVVDYVHQRTLQRLTLSAIARDAPSAPNY